MTFLLCACGCGGALHGVSAVSRTLWPPRRLTAPVTEPISLADAKLHLRVEHTADDALIQNQISAARAFIEDYCSRAIGAQSWQQTVDGSPDALPIPLTRAPVTAVTTVELVDTTGTRLAVAGTILDNAVIPARVYPPTAGWPAAPAGQSWVRTQVAYDAGSEVTPEPIRQALLLLLGQWYDHRATIHVGSGSVTLPFAFRELLSTYCTTIGLAAA